MTTTADTTDTTATAALGQPVMPSGWDPARQPRGGLTAEQVAALALRCARAELALAGTREHILNVGREASDWQADAAAEHVRVVELEGLLTRAAWGKPWILREAGLL